MRFCVFLVLLSLPAFLAAEGERDFHRELTNSPLIALSDSARRAMELAGRHYSAAARMEAGELPQQTPQDISFSIGLGDNALRAARPELGKNAAVLDFREAQTVRNEGVLSLPQLSADVLLKVVTGEGEPVFRVRELNMSTSGDGRLPRLMIAPDTETWILLKLREIPPGPHVQQFEFVSPDSGEPQNWGSIAIETEEPGQLALTVLDEHGAETPALVRIVNEQGLHWEPPNAIDYRPTMLDITGLPIYGPGRGYTNYLMGEYRGPFWIVPGPFEVAAPPGEWEIVIYKGLEHKPVRKSLEVCAGEWTRETVQLERWVNMAERGWYSGDDHVHSRVLSSADAEDVVTWGQAAGVNVLNVLEMGNETRTWYTQRGYGPDFRVRRGDTVLVPGQEDPRSPFGHILGLDLTAMARDVETYLLNDLIADKIHEQGGLYGQTHVGEGGLGIIRDMTLTIPEDKVDFASIMQNILGTTRYYDFLDLGFRLTASAGSDTPYGGAIGISRVYAYTGDADGLEADAWFQALKDGHTFATNGPLIDFRVEDVFLPGDEIPVNENTPPVYVTVRASGVPGYTSPSRVALVYNGEEVAVAEEPDADAGKVTLEYNLAPGFGGWLAARVDGHNGSSAHTTPVYLTREGFRHWNVERAGKLIADRMETIAEIEEMTREQKQRLESGEMSPLDYWNGHLARQAERIFERTARARDYYENLREVLQRERELRGLNSGAGEKAGAGSG